MGRKRIEESEKKKAVSVSIKYSMLEAIDLVAENRSEFIRAAVEKALDEEREQTENKDKK